MRMIYHYNDEQERASSQKEKQATGEAAAEAGWTKCDHENYDYDDDDYDEHDNDDNNLNHNFYSAQRFGSPVCV